MTRQYADWLVDAKQHRQSIDELAAELREHWPQWKDMSEYRTWDECCQAELGVTANALRLRRHKAGTKDDVGPHVQGNAGQDREPSKPRSGVADPPDVTDKLAEAVKLAATGMSYRAIGPAVGLDESVVRRDPAVRAARVQADPEAHSVTLKTRSLACRIESAAELIDRLEVTIDALIQPGDYQLSISDRKRIRRILAGAMERISV